jgi:hypothetical protein
MIGREPLSRNLDPYNDIARLPSAFSARALPSSDSRKAPMCAGCVCCVGFFLSHRGLLAELSPRALARPTIQQVWFACFVFNRRFAFRKPGRVRQGHSLKGASESSTLQNSGVRNSCLYLNHAQSACWTKSIRTKAPGGPYAAGIPPAYTPLEISVRRRKAMP